MLSTYLSTHLSVYLSILDGSKGYIQTAHVGVSGPKEQDLHMNWGSETRSGW